MATQFSCKDKNLKILYSSWCAKEECRLSIVKTRRISQSLSSHKCECTGGFHDDFFLMSAVDQENYFLFLIRS